MLDFYFRNNEYVRKILCDNREENIGENSPWNKSILKLLNEKKEKNKDIIDKYNKLKSEVDLLQIEYDKMLEKDNMALTKRENIFKRIINRITGEYKRQQEEYDKKRRSLEKDIQKKQTELTEKKKEKVDAEKELEKLNNPEQYSKKNINQLIQEDSTRLKDPEFMTAMVMSFPQAIILDQSNDERVYNQFFRQYCHRLERLDQAALYGAETSDMQTHYDVIRAFELVTKLVEEINNPKIPENGKYKIPREILFETTKTLIAQYINNSVRNITQMFDGGAVGSYGALEKYFELDCNLPQEYGSQLEKMYKNEDNYVLQHQIAIPGIVENKEEYVKSIVESIMKSGVRASTQGMDKANLARTLSGNTYKADALLFPNLLSTSSTKVIASIPKKALDDENSMIWRKNSDEVAEYLNPEFIVGYIDEGNAKFNPNPISIDNRKKFSEMVKNNHDTKSKGIDWEEDRLY